jgi:transglutaminase-like putative cysteine protease
MNQKNDSMEKYLRSTEIIDWTQTNVFRLAGSLAAQARDETEIAKRCFEWVRDKVKHSYDYQCSPVTCSASEVLATGTGYCFAKSHLLVAILRANSIPAGFCYQRLSRDDQGPPFVLHGLVAAHLPRYGWYRMDPRGNRADIDSRFTPPIERLAFRLGLPGEADLPEIWTDPLPVVVEALRAYPTWDALWENLPDIELLP